MNERIKLLAEQATSIVDMKHEGYRGKGYTEQVEFFDKEKFAELIIKECAGIYSKIDNGNLHMGTDNYLEALHKTFRS